MRSTWRTDVLTCFFFFQAEDGIRDLTVTGVQTCALPIYRPPEARRSPQAHSGDHVVDRRQERVRDVRAHDRADRARGAQADRRGRSERGPVGRHPGQTVPEPRGEGGRRRAAARPEAQAGALTGGLVRGIQEAREGRRGGRACRRPRGAPPAPPPHTEPPPPPASGAPLLAPLPSPPPPLVLL